MKKVLLALCVGISVFLASQAQNKESWSRLKFSQYFHASDQLHRNGEKYLLHRSFLSAFDNYKKLYPEIPIMEITSTDIGMSIGTTSGYRYRPVWVIQDSSLYLCEVGFYLRREQVLRLYPANRQYSPIEKLTGRKFLNKYHFPEGTPLSPVGAMKADWVNGEFYTKRARKYLADGTEENFDTWWKQAKIQKLTFRNGKLVSVETAE